MRTITSLHADRLEDRDLTRKPVSLDGIYLHERYLVHVHNVSPDVDATTDLNTDLFAAGKIAMGGWGHWPTQGFLQNNMTYPYIVYNDLPKLAALKKQYPQLCKR